MPRPKRHLACPCGKPAEAGRYRRQGPPLCYQCYMACRYTDPESPFRRVGREYITSMKAGKPCTDCAGYFPTCCLEWDHVPERGPKLFNLGNGDYSIEKIKAEITKCDLVCANCHAMRTWNRNREQRVAPAAEAELPVAGDDGSAVTADEMLF